MRVKRGISTHKHHKQITKKTKGYLQSRGNFRKAKEAVLKAGQYAYRDRRNKKRDLRGLWITRINAAARELGTTYGKLIAGLKLANIQLDRKVLSELAVKEPKAFAEIVKEAK